MQPSRYSYAYISTLYTESPATDIATSGIFDRLNSTAKTALIIAGVACAFLLLSIAVGLLLSRNRRRRSKQQQQEQQQPIHEPMYSAASRPISSNDDDMAYESSQLSPVRKNTQVLKVSQLHPSASTQNVYDTVDATAVTAAAANSNATAYFETSLYKSATV